MSWIAPHAAAILRYRSRGDDGKTPYDRIRLRPVNTRLVAVGGRCSYKLWSKEPTDEEHKKFQGIFRGICSNTSPKWAEGSGVFQIRPHGMQRILKLYECRHMTCIRRPNRE